MEAAELLWGKWEKNQTLNILIMQTYMELRRKNEKKFKETK